MPVLGRAAATTACFAVIIGAATSGSAPSVVCACGGEGALPLHRVVPGVLGVRAGVAPRGRRGEESGLVKQCFKDNITKLCPLSRDIL